MKRNIRKLIKKKKKNKELGLNLRPLNLDMGYVEFNFELEKQFQEHNFRDKNIIESPSCQVWVEVIDYLIVLLHDSFTYASTLRKSAQNWKREDTHMSPRISLLLKIRFKERLKDKSEISNGHSDHWVDQIPIEDKLLRNSNNTNIQEIINKVYEENKKQIFREAGFCGFGVILVVDIRGDIKKNKIPASPITKCFRIFYEKDFWTTVFIFQAFTKTPSKI